VETTLSLAKRTGKLINVDSIDEETGSSMDTQVVPAHIVAVRIEKQGDLLGAVA
jgi:hypothetical protein